MPRIHTHTSKGHTHTTTQPTACECCGPCQLLRGDGAHATTASLKTLPPTIISGDHTPSIHLNHNQELPWLVQPAALKKRDAVIYVSKRTPRTHIHILNCHYRLLAANGQCCDDSQVQYRSTHTYTRCRLTTGGQRQCVAVANLLQQSAQTHKHTHNSKQATTKQDCKHRHSSCKQM